jgi:hypothetical protein
MGRVSTGWVADFSVGGGGDDLCYDAPRMDETDHNDMHTSMSGPHQRTSYMVCGLNYAIPPETQPVDTIRPSRQVLLPY